jgi:hypothetical protein
MYDALFSDIVGLCTYSKSNGNLNSLPMAGTLRTMSVPSIVALFQSKASNALAGI